SRVSLRHASPASLKGSATITHRSALKGCISSKDWRVRLLGRVRSGGIFPHAPAPEAGIVVAPFAASFRQRDQSPGIASSENQTIGLEGGLEHHAGVGDRLPPDFDSISLQSVVIQKMVQVLA